MSKDIREMIDKIKNINRIVNEDVESDNIKIYHGTPFKVSADSIKRSGLQQVGDFIVAGGDGSPSMTNRSYVAKELWNAVRYSFLIPGSMNMEWAEYISK